MVVSVKYKGIEYYLSDEDKEELPPIYKLLIKMLGKEKITNAICIDLGYENYGLKDYIVTKIN